MGRRWPALVAAVFFVPWPTWLLASDQIKTGQVFRDCPDCPEMVMLPAGVFVMGDSGRNKQEHPPHRVILSRPFAIGRTELTFDAWDACHAAGGCPEAPHDHGWGRGDRPVINITVADIEDYIAWISSRTGHAYRLPSEAEWEYAARAGTATQYWWGNGVGDNLTNCRGCGSPWSGKGSAPVASFTANPFGLHDTSGNVWEWVADCWNPDHKGAPSDGSARRDGDCQSQVIRGGSWYYFSKLARSAYRFKNNIQVKSYNIGVRLARDP